MNESSTTAITYNVSMGFGTVASAFIVESLGHMIPWLIFAFGIIVLDLITGIIKVIALKQKLRLSKGIRDTMAKTVTYFAAVVVACFFTVASEGEGSVEKWTCVLIYVIEGISVFGNIMKTRGYNVDSIALFGIIASKFGFEMEDAKEAITKDETPVGSEGAYRPRPLRKRK